MVKVRNEALKLCNLIVIAGLSQCVGANRYCAFEIDGENKYYVCPRTETCCNIGCCVNNLAFHFYQLWYYWLVILFMFMICSGGGWWYRFCRGARISSNPPSSSAHASRYSRHYQTAHPSSDVTQSSNIRTHRPHFSDRHCHQHHSTLSDRRVRPCAHQRQYYYLQRIWKNTEPNVIHQQQIPPSYSYSIVNLLPNAPQGTSNVADPPRDLCPNPQRRPIGCPYYQLYGPPPSYDSVVQLTDSGVVTEAVSGNSQLIVPNLRAIERGVTEEEYNRDIVISGPVCNSDTSNMPTRSVDNDASISAKCNSTPALEGFNSTIISDQLPASGTLLRSYSADASKFNFEEVASTSSAT